MNPDTIRVLDKYFPNVVTNIIIDKITPHYLNRGDTFESYDIHDNGGRPFCVHVNKNIVIICEYGSGKILYVYKALKIYIGIDHLTVYDGNSILLQMTKKRFIFIGWNIYEFEIEDDIVKYYSPVGNNDVPYPVLQGTKYVYFMIDYSYVDIELIKGNMEDAYDEYYNGLMKSSMGMKNVKNIHKRGL